jgi:hypothetical protein
MTKKLFGAFSRANSTFRLWSYRRRDGEALSFWWAVGEWFRRFAFELRNIK